MTEPRNWTVEETDLIRARRSEKKTWREIALELGIARHTVTHYAKESGIWTEPLPSLRHAASAEALDPNRLPLPPGHTYTWGAITRGTLLEGVPYPL